MVYLEHSFTDGTGIRIVDVPYPELKREVPTIQYRISRQGEKVRILKCMLFDKETGEDLFAELLENLLQVKLKEIGHQCEKCEKYFLPNSPAQRQCGDCKIGAIIAGDDEDKLDEGAE
ncbi:hypothetical protein LCGC14_0947040 [marine sediment metagenome]|uniref:Uncharacterized protein n=1 Tax=marine sediment metagenome TaxID=412755 RepID=A0A0F9NII9_9ZZZZ